MAALSGMLVPFVGAGVSMLAGCPLWKEFADKVMMHMVTHGVIPQAQYDQMLKDQSIVRLSYSLYLARKHNVRIPFDDILHPEPALAHPEGRRLYAYISRLAKVFVTTNYDKWLDQILALAEIAPAGAGATSAAVMQQLVQVQKERKVILDPRDMTPHVLSVPDTVIHLHGSLNNYDSMIVRTRHYAGHYANDRTFKNAQDENMVLTFLTYLFANRTLLFMGYGLTEFDILERAIIKGPQGLSDNGEPRHFMLQGFLQGEEERVEGLTAYYAHEFGITLLPFLRVPGKDWHQLIDVLEFYSRELPAKDPIMARRLSAMGGLLP
jgi:hypothetical protein